MQQSNKQVYTYAHTKENLLGPGESESQTEIVPPRIAFSDADYESCVN